MKTFKTLLITFILILCLSFSAFAEEASSVAEMKNPAGTLLCVAHGGIHTEHEENSSPFEVEQSVLAAFYDLWVGGVQVTSANNDDVLGNDTVSFSADENILTLDGANITAAVADGNVCGMQFHPEKSGKVGLSILAAFCGTDPARIGK